MPRKQVGQFKGDAVHAGDGEYRYDHPDETTVWVHPDPDEHGRTSDDRWGVTVQTSSYEMGDLYHDGPKTIEYDVSKSEAFRRAYQWMEGYKPSKVDGFEFGGFGL